VAGNSTADDSERDELHGDDESRGEVVGLMGRLVLWVGWFLGWFSWAAGNTRVGK
jgi:hypothetical protein